jgi:hypothetical protein
MRQYPLNRYVPGTYKRECDVCGWDYLRSELKERYDGAIVCEKDWEPEPREWRKRNRIKERPLRRD